MEESWAIREKNISIGFKNKTMQAQSASLTWTWMKSLKAFLRLQAAD